MKHSRGHTRRRGGIYAGNVPRRLVKKKGGIFDLAVAALKNPEVQGLIRSKSVTRQFKAQQNKK